MPFIRWPGVWTIREQPGKQVLLNNSKPRSQWQQQTYCAVLFYEPPASIERDEPPLIPILK